MPSPHLYFVCLLCCAAILARGTSAAEPQPLPVERFRKVAEAVYVGGEPKTPEAFAALKKAGVTTLVSVDGLRPDVEEARKHGLRYIHIPMGYSGVDETSALTLARVAKEVDGPLFVHCHHGQHRGPAAAAVILRVRGATTEQAVNVLKQCETGKEYAGLWRDVESHRPPPADARLPELRERVDAPSLAQAMAEADRIFGRLKLLRAADWKTRADHSDLTPAREALLLAEALDTSHRLLTAEQRAHFGADLRKSWQDARSLKDTLEKGDAAAANRTMDAIRQDCLSCHRVHRDEISAPPPNPLK